MTIKYTIDTEKKIIFETWSDFVTFDDYVNMKKKEFSDSMFRPEYDVVTDLNLLNQCFNEENINKIIEFIQNNSAQIKNRKSAIIADTPNAVACSVVFRDKSVNLPLDVRIFSTREAAIKWLKTA